MGQGSFIPMWDLTGNPTTILGFLVGVTVEHTTPQPMWKTDNPMWVDQWPLSLENLSALESPVEEQLSKGHIIPSNSPWISSVFVLKKPGKDRWRLLHDL